MIDSSREAENIALLQTLLICISFYACLLRP
jgi:hypothetical protein